MPAGFVKGQHAMVTPSALSRVRVTIIKKIHGRPKCTSEINFLKMELRLKIGGNLQAVAVFAWEALH